MPGEIEKCPGCGGEDIGVKLKEGSTTGEGVAYCRHCGAEID